MAIPFVLVGACPGEPSGVSRIITEIGHRLWDAREALGIDLLQVGATASAALPKRGLAVWSPVPWPVWAHNETTSPLDAVKAAIEFRYGKGVDAGILFSVQDPARSFSLLEKVTVPSDRWARWGYLSLDGVNEKGSIGGPAAQTIQRYDRVAAYGQWAAEIFQNIRQVGRAREIVGPIPAIPHGINRDIFAPITRPDEYLRAIEILTPTSSSQMVVGCVATNQARKDLGLFIQTISWLQRNTQLNLRGWLHIDDDVADAWSIPELAKIYGLDWHTLTVTKNLTDRELALCYASCIATIAPGRGEGFGYPIVESQACGTPVVHLKYGGGVEHLDPAFSIAVPPVYLHVEGPYGIQRPLGSPGIMAEAVLRAMHHVDTSERRLALREWTRQYDHDDVWHNKMLPWIREGLEQCRHEWITSQGRQPGGSWTGHPTTRPVGGVRHEGSADRAGGPDRGPGAADAGVRGDGDPAEPQPERAPGDVADHRDVAGADDGSGEHGADRGAVDSAGAAPSRARRIGPNRFLG
jgi:glycosyltransferase involved in cell wall biosynthesis